MSIRSSIEFKYAHCSDRGYARRTNEDTSAVDVIELTDGKRAILAAVADGMGGGHAGAEASQIAVSTAFQHVHEAVRRNAPRDSAHWQQLLIEALRGANGAVLARGKSTNRLNMGTTLMLALIVGRRALIAHISDCRAYAIRPAVRRPHITQLTVEHTVVAELVGRGALSYAEADGHPQRHHLARAVGVDASIEPEVVARTLRANERLLLCSDGLPLHLSDTDLARIVSNTSTPQEACDQLIALANARGGRDNLSAVVIAAAPADPATTSALLAS